MGQNQSLNGTCCIVQQRRDKQWPPDATNLVRRNIEKRQRVVACQSHPQRLNHYVCGWILPHHWQPSVESGKTTKTTEGTTQTVAKQKCVHDNHIWDVIIHQKKNEQKGTAVGGRRGFPFVLSESVGVCGALALQRALPETMTARLSSKTSM
jgi:hypothetical protein